MTNEELVGRLREELKKCLPYEKLYEEIKEYTVSLEEEPRLDQINKKFSLVQSWRDRVCKLLLDAIRNTRRYERIYQTLFDAEIVKREEKSADLREANVNNIIREFYDTLKEAKDYETSLRVVYDNLKAANENISRQVTVLSEQIHLGELGK